jgi:ribose transport system substrate-binding protein
MQKRKEPFMNRIAHAVGLLGLIVALAGCNKSNDHASTSGQPGGATTAPAAGNYTIAVIPKGTTHVYWKAMQAGAEQAGKDLGVTIRYKGPMLEDDRSGQISLVQQFVSDGVSGIVLAPLDEAALLPASQSAMAAKIPVVVIDSRLNGAVGTDFISLVATNNRQGGQMAGAELSRILGNKGKIVMLRYSAGSASTEDREAGFLDVIHSHPDMTMLVENRYAGATVDKAFDASLNLLDQLKQADGIFASNESATMGMLKALRESNLTGKVHFIGFDATPQLIDALKAGDLDGLVAQNPKHMGYLAVQTCVNYLKGQKVQPSIDSGAQLITHDNLNDPAVQKLLAGD